MTDTNDDIGLCYGATKSIERLLIHTAVTLPNIQLLVFINHVTRCQQAEPVTSVTSFLIYKYQLSNMYVIFL